MRILADVSIWNVAPDKYERVWFGARIIILWWRLSFRVSRGLTPGHLGSEGRPLIRFFLGTSKYHVRCFTTAITKDAGSGVTQLKTVYRWSLRFRGTKSKTGSN